MTDDQRAVLDLAGKLGHYPSWREVKQNLGFGSSRTTTARAEAEPMWDGKPSPTAKYRVGTGVQLAPFVERVQEARQETREMRLDLETLMDAARSRQSIPSGLFDMTDVRFRVKRPTVFVFWGDWHLGAEGTDYDQFEHDLEILTEAKARLGGQLQVIAMGDYIDGYLPSGTPRNPTQILGPREQRLAATEALSRVKPLLALEGDHDAWHAKQDVEMSWLFEFCEQQGIAFAQWGTKLTLELAERQEPLVALVRHRYKGSRASDVLGPHKRLHLEHGPAELVALAHVPSNPGVFRAHAKRKAEGEFLCVQSGTVKLIDDYAKKLGYLESDYGVPALVVFPDGTIEPFDAVEDAIQRLT